MTWLLVRLVRLFNAHDAMVRDYARERNCYGGIVAPNGEVVPAISIRPVFQQEYQRMPTPIEQAEEAIDEFTGR